MKAMKKITKIWFDGEHIFGEDEQGKILKQSLLWYPKLKDATDEERAQYTTGLDGFHWRALDEDVSFESFEYEDAEPSVLQRFFMTHPEINIAEFAKKCKIKITLTNFLVRNCTINTIPQIQIKCYRLLYYEKAY